MAPRLRTKPDRLIVAGLVALALLALGEQAPAAFPVHVSIEAGAANLDISVDGQTHSLSSALGGGWQSITLEKPGPAQREYQVDGSDTTSTNDRDAQLIGGLLGTPLYAFDAWLRDEGSYSRWENLRITDLRTGQTVPLPEALRVTDVATGQVAPLSAPLPEEFRVEVDLRRPESRAHLWLVAGPDRREGLELDRDRRNARWLIQRGTGTDALPRWFFPEQPAPFAAELLWLLGRSAAVAYVLALLALAPGALMAPARIALAIRQRMGPAERNLSERISPERTVPEWTAWERTFSAEQRSMATGDGWAALAVSVAALGCWFATAALISVREFHQLPHILDAVSYTFQAGLFSTGQLALPAPEAIDAFKGPFEVVWQGRLFSQYPPGAPAIYAFGRAVSLEWLVGPLACAVLIGCTAWSARALFGAATGWAALALGVISPFVLFQAGSYLSHPIVGGLLAAALAAFVAGECRGSARWYAVCGALLGAAFLTREAASVLFAVPLGIRLLAKRRAMPLSRVVAFGIPFVVAYLVYDLRQTGNPLLLPRTIFDASDHFGFGDGIGFHMRHTLAAGLANTDELLTLLQFDISGWPPLFGLSLLGLPLLIGRPRVWDGVALGGLLAFVVAYVGYFYHGNALGPRYYFEAMPWLLLLGARGAALLADLARRWLVPVALLGLLTLNTFFFYLPAEIDRRANFSGLPGAMPLVLDFVEPTLFGPRLVGVPEPALVITSDWWVYNAALAALNCPRLPNCPVLFALATSPDESAHLHALYPDRVVLQASVADGHVTLHPGTL